MEEAKEQVHPLSDIHSLNIPGPGAYTSAHNPKAHAPSWTMGGNRSTQHKQLDVPGPGAYSNSASHFQVEILSE